MMKRLRSILSRPARAPAPVQKADAPQPDRPVYVVGDLHGRADLLERLLEMIDIDIGETRATNPHLIFVGDYIDNGPDSAEVLLRLRELDTDLPENVTCLMGNHDKMMLDFLEDPATRGRRWLRSGAETTLDSYGLCAPGADMAQDANVLLDLATALTARMPTGMTRWLGDRPLNWSSGNLWVVHAAADPQHLMTDQNPRSLLWGHPEFETRRRSDGIWIAHGHNQVESPVLDQGRIATDTGAWHSGHLTACAIRTDGTHRFLQT